MIQPQGLRAVGFEMFRPISPILASAESVEDAIGSFDRASVEWKLDGIRIPIHRLCEEVRIYTRNVNDVMYALPGIVDFVRRLGVGSRTARPRRGASHRTRGRSRITPCLCLPP